MEYDQGQVIANVEADFENSKAARLIARHKWEAAKGKLHMSLVARREAGETLTIADMEAIEAAAIDNVPEVKDAYLAFIEADSKYRDAKVKWEAAKRAYWDGKEVRR